MIKSMTGYGRVVERVNNKTITVEIKSLNSKSLDLNVFLPRVFKHKELTLRKEIASILERGKVDISLSIEAAASDKAIAINKSLVKSYYKQLKDLAEELNESNANLLQMATRMPDVIERVKQVGEEKQWNKVKAAIIQAVKKVDAFRRQEGQFLEKDLKLRLNNIHKSLAKVEKMEIKRSEKIKDKLKLSLQEFIEQEKIDKNRLEQELIYYLEKLDITEEITRLKSHYTYFIKTLQESQPIKGKKLAFIAQEIGREINTIGSKANDADIQKTVVEMKDQLEKIKEQMLNVL